MKKIFKTILDRIVNWLLLHNWFVVGSFIMFLIALEVYEVIYTHDHLGNPFHLIELSMYIILLFFLGVLVDHLKVANAAQKHNFDMLQFRHKISLELTEIEEWDMLIPNLVEFPGKIVPVAASCIYLFNQISGNFELEAEWLDDDVSNAGWNQECPSRFLNQGDMVSLYTLSSKVISQDEGSEIVQTDFCLPITYSNDLLALIHFRLRPGETISEEQKLILESIAPEIALALKANLEQKKLFEFRQTQLALSERHAISNYLHDNLSPNLAYLKLKLDYFISGKAQKSIDNGVSELQQMKEATDQSYDIVRKIIEAIHAKTTPHLINLIDAHIKKVSNRAGIDILLEKKGTEIPALPETQRAVFNVFLEALNNIEKHSRAKTAKVLVEWGESDLSVKISDDGIGFTPQSINGTEHLGLKIMQERIESVHGRVDITSAVNTGTVVSIFVPLQDGQGERTR